MANNKIDSVVDGIGDLALIVSLIPGLSIVGAAHLPIKYGERILKKMGVIKEDIPNAISNDFHQIVYDTLQETSRKIHSGVYKEFLQDSFDRYKNQSTQNNTASLDFEEQDKLMKKCMKESISAGGYYITPKDINDFKEMVDTEFAYQLYKHPDFGVFINYITGKEQNERIRILEKYFEEFKKGNIPPHTITLPPIVKTNNELIGRDDDIDKVSELLESNQPVVLVNGIGGVGKSALCKYYCTKCKCNVGWFDYEESLKNTLLKIADESKLGTEAGRNSEFTRVKNYLSSLPHDTILAFDNVFNEVKEEIDFLCSLKCKVILTSRRRFNAFGTSFRALNLDFLSPDACRELFNHYCFDRTVDTNDKYLKQITDMAGYHTLTIELLARIYDTSGIDTLKDLWKLLNEKGFNIDEKTSATGKIEEKEFIEHLQILFDISDIDDDMIHVLKNLSILPSVPVKHSKIRQWLGDKYNDALRSLVNTGWLKKEDNNIVMHNVICETLKIKLEPSYQDCNNLAASLAEELNYQNYEIESYNPPYFNQCLAVAIYFQNKGIEENELAYLYHNIGFIYDGIGEYNKALEYYNQALDIEEKVLGTEHPSTATSYNNIGGVYDNIGEYNKALEYYNQALAIREKVLGTEHPDTASTYNNIGGVYKNMGEYKKVLEYYNKALDIVEKVLGTEHPDTASTYNNIGEVYRNMGEYNNALEYYNKDLAICEKVLGKEHPSTATSYNNIGLVYKNMGEYKKALEYNKQALDIREKVLGTEHPSTATSYNNIGLVYMNMGEYNKALEYYNKDLAINEKVLGTEHPDTANTYNNIGGVYNNMGEYNKALEYYNMGLDIYEKVLGTEHPSTATSYNNIGGVYYSMGEYNKALEYYNQALDILEKVLGTEHPYTATSYNNIGMVYKNMGEYNKALEYYNKALDIREKVLGTEHPDTAISYNNIALLYYNMNEYGQALDMMVKALYINLKVLGQNHPNTQSSIRNLRVIYKAYNKSMDGFDEWVDGKLKEMSEGDSGESDGSV